MPVKENHKTLYTKMACFFNNPASATLFEAQFHTAEEITSKRGRDEIRRVRVSAQMPQKYTGFPGVQQVFQLTRTVTHRKSGHVTEETLFGMTSLTTRQATPEHLLALMRGHWTIENRSHYVRDVTFGEDVCRVRNGGAHQVLAALRNACIGRLRLDGVTNIAARRRFYAANPLQALQLIGYTMKTG